MSRVFLASLLTSCSVFFAMPSYADTQVAPVQASAKEAADSNEHEHEHEHEEHTAHEHGSARLMLTVSGNTVALLLDSPAVNIYGFEQVARTEVEKEAITQSDTKLQKGEALFGFEKAADCKLIQAGFKPTEIKPEAATNHDDEPETEEHRDIEYSWVFQCTNPTALKSVTPQLFSNFSGLKKLELQWVNAQGASAVQLDQDAKVELQP